MYNISIKDAKSNLKKHYISLFAGIFMLTLMCVVSFLTDDHLVNLDSSVVSSSVNVVHNHINNDGKYKYSLVYYYEVDGAEYICESSILWNFRPSTINLVVFYDSSKPSSCTTGISVGIMLIFASIPLISIIIFTVSIVNTKKRIKVIKKLNEKGKLIKNLPCRLENPKKTNKYIRNRLSVVDYTLPSGVTITIPVITGSESVEFNADGTVDLVIDEDNPKNYFIGANIERIDGGLSQDFCQTAPITPVAEQAKQAEQRGQNSVFDDIESQDVAQGIDRERNHESGEK